MKAAKDTNSTHKNGGYYFRCWNSTIGYSYMIQRYIITGGPATGKSSIIEYFQQIGHPCFEEVSRGFIQEQNIQTSAKNFDFEAAVFRERKTQYLAATKLHFYDRSMLMD